VVFEPFSGLPPVLGDRIQVYQVVLNLIMNGLEATAERPPGNRWLSVRTAESDGGGVRFTVRDSGKESRKVTCPACLSRSSPPSRKAWVSACRSAAPS
jgi:nitrogen-specific signal transduction histidine kinase